MTRREKRELKRALKNKKNLIIAIIILGLTIISGKALYENSQYESRIAELKNDISDLSYSYEEIANDTESLYEEICSKYPDLDACNL